MMRIVFSNWRKGLFFFGLWTLLGLSSAAQFYFSSLALEKPIAWSRAWRAALTDWYVLGLLFLPTWYLSLQFALERPLRLRHVAIHLAGSGLFSVAHLAIYVLARAVVFPTDHFAFVESFNFWFVRRFHGNLLYYWTFLIAAHALTWHRRLREREIKAAELEARLARTQLEALKTQLQPHFLFNTLNMISELVHESPDAADRMLTKLSDLLRLSLKAAAHQEVSLAEELAFVEPYLDIQRVRMGGQLKTSWDVAPETLQAQVPNLLLQPIIENAVRHGIGRSSEGGTIALTARRVNGKLMIIVRDSGAGPLMPAIQTVKEGIGLSNLRERLHCLYGDNCEFRFGGCPGGGFEVTVCLPLNSRH